jgi:hypothetical protein
MSAQEQTTKTIVVVPLAEWDDEPEDDGSAPRRPLEQTSDMTRYDKYHSEIMRTYLTLQREYM